jgi:glycosyltransferase involved in cell wall biosynthesis
VAGSKKNLPLVSICIPAYNAERFIAETLESALRQDYPNCEIIVSDDCSTDQTPAIVRNYAGRKVGLIRQEKNLGICGNYNAVIKLSNGKFICKLDADDLLEPQYISSLAAVMEAHPAITFSHCACRLIDIDGNFIGYERSVQGSFIRRGLDEWPRYLFGPKAVNIVMIRRASYDKVGGYDQRFVTGDWKMHRDLLKLGDVYYNDAVLASYRVHEIGKRYRVDGAAKKGLSLIKAREHLMHLEDMEMGWPPGLPGKQQLMRQARRSMGYSLVISAAHAAEPTEAREILAYLPRYGNFIGPRVLAGLVRLGGSEVIRGYLKYKLRLRQVVKQFLYKRPNLQGL